MSESKSNEFSGGQDFQNDRLQSNSLQKASLEKASPEIDSPEIDSPEKDSQHSCEQDGEQTGCERGGARPGCGRKPGIKTLPIRLPQWLINQLEQEGDVKQLIIDACKKQYNLQCDQNSECK